MSPTEPSNMEIGYQRIEEKSEITVMKKSTKIILWTVGAVVSTLIIALIAITSTILSRTPMKSTIPDSPLLKSGGTDPLTLKLL